MSVRAIVLLTVLSLTLCACAITMIFDLGMYWDAPKLQWG